MDYLTIRSTDESEDEKIKEECCPGNPFIGFSVQDYLIISVKNVQPSSGYFSANVRVMEGDNIENVQNRMKREGIVKGNISHFKIYLACANGHYNFYADVKKLELFCYSDPQLGPRAIPPEDILKSDMLTKLNGSGVFHVDSEKQTISFDAGATGNVITVGSQLIYFVDLS